MTRLCHDGDESVRATLLRVNVCAVYSLAQRAGAAFDCISAAANGAHHHYKQETPCPTLPTEFDQLVITSNGVPPFGKLDATTKLQTVTIGGSASAAFQPTTKFVRLVADATCILSYTPPGGEAVEVAFLGSDLKGECFGVDPFGTISAATAS
jgi:hypothetical protein